MAKNLVITLTIVADDEMTRALRHDITDALIQEAQKYSNHGVVATHAIEETDTMDTSYRYL